MEDISVLVAEDDTDTRLLLQTLLEMSGFTIVPAADGAQAIHWLAHFTPDVILTDLMMPNVSGLELIVHVKSDARLAKIPVVAVTAYGSGELRQAMAAGADATLQKPVDPGHLMAVLRQVLP
jgi:CheY-like chemotaxis protein